MTLKKELIYPAFLREASQLIPCDGLNRFVPPPVADCFTCNEELEQTVHAVLLNCEGAHPVNEKLEQRKVASLAKKANNKTAAESVIKDQDSSHAAASQATIELTKHIIPKRVQLFASRPCCRNFRAVFKSTEDIIADPDLNELLRLIKFELNQLIDISTTSVGIVTKQDAKNSMHTDNIAFDLSGRVHPEGCLFLECDGKKFFLCGIEAKRNTTSIAEAKPQGFALVGDLARRLRICNCKLEYCIVPVLLGNGENIQFGASYLMEESMPVFCLLSRKLNRLHRGDLIEIRWWVHHLARLIFKVFQEAMSTYSITTPLQKKGPCLSVEKHFFKHIRDSHNETNGSPLISSHRITLTRILQIYRTLHNSAVKTHILFPRGTIQLDGKTTGREAGIHSQIVANMVQRDGLKMTDTIKKSSIPVLVYRRLDESWKTSVPKNKASKTYFIKLLRSVMEICSGLGIVFLDLRMSNIMWRSRMDTIEIKIVDFEHVYFKGDMISTHLFAVHARDYRRNHNLYPLVGTDLRVADTATNSFSVNAIEAYVNHGDEHTSYRQFMASKRMQQYMEYYNERVHSSPTYAKFLSDQLV